MDDGLQSNSVYKELLVKQYEINMESNRILNELSETSKGIHNILESQNETLKRNTESLLVNAEATKTWGKIAWLLVIAMCILAGAEKVIQVVGG